ncbi:MAG: ATP-dependent Clp protease ATP-binding subunit [Eubacterium sp.]|nr:ATP-dependent Clp protease ATP-binding subunit [Eubacterium sp.]
MTGISYSDTIKHALSEAANIARKLGSPFVDARHIFISLYTIHKGVAYSVMLKSGLRAEDFQKLAGEIRNQSFELQPVDFENRLTDRTEKIIDEAEEDAARLKQTSLGTELVLLSILRDMNNDIFAVLKAKNINVSSMCVELLMSLGLTKKEAEKYSGEYIVKIGKGKIQSKSKTMLEQYGRDLTEEAKNGRLDPIVGRHDEIVRVLQILGRRTKNNVCLVGEPGVGKTAIVEGLAQLIVGGKLPESFLEKKIISLDLNAMVAGTRYRGDFEERLKKALDELKADPDIILFIDELHTLIGAGGSEGTHDAANIFKPALSRGELQVIGATTLEEYRKYIEKDAALERRFQPVTVDEPTAAETVEILNALRENYQLFHNVKVEDEAVDAAVTMSIRYINDRFLPDKAIDLLDEACSRKKMGTMPEDFSDELAGNLEKSMNRALEEALRTGDVKAASRLKQGISSKKDGTDDSSEMKLVTADDIASVVSVWAKIPVSRLTESEQSRLLRLEDSLHKRIIGQDEAVKALSNSIRRSRVGLRESNRPIGSFLFLGPTGVGKTEVSKALAEVLFGDEKSLIRVDMSEYMEKHSVSKMIGSPPGYVGYDEGGQLSEKVRRNPYSVLLFDEIEKAHPDVYNILLQVLDDGLITDAQGRKVDFKNTVIIMTSNLGADKIIDPKNMGFITDNSEEKSFENMKSQVMEEVKKHFRPEFLNRLDDVVVFRSLNETEIREIAGLQLGELKTRVKENLKIDISFGNRLKDFIFDKGYDKKFGARPLRRAIQTHVEDPLATELLQGRIKEGDTVSVSVVKDKVTFKTKEKSQ